MRTYELVGALYPSGDVLGETRASAPAITIVTIASLHADSTTSTGTIRIAASAFVVRFERRATELPPPPAKRALFELMWSAERRNALHSRIELVDQSRPPMPAATRHAPTVASTPCGENGSEGLVRQTDTAQTQPVR